MVEMGKLQEMPRWRSSLDYEKGSGLDKVFGEKHSLFSKLTPRRIRRRPTRLLGLIIVFLVLASTYLSLSFFLQRRHLSDGMLDLVTIKDVKLPKLTKRPLPPGVPKWPGVYVAPAVDHNQLHALAEGKLDRKNQDAYEEPLPPPMHPRLKKPGQRPGPPLIKPWVKFTPEMAFRSAKPEQHGAPDVDRSQPMPPPAARPNIHGVPAPGTIISFQPRGGKSVLPIGSNQYMPPVRPASTVPGDTDEQSSPGDPNVVAGPYMPPGQPIPQQYVPPGTPDVLAGSYQPPVQPVTGPYIPPVPSIPGQPGRPLFWLYAPPVQPIPGQPVPYMLTQPIAPIPGQPVPLSPGQLVPPIPPGPHVLGQPVPPVAPIVSSGQFDPLQKAIQVGEVAPQAAPGNPPEAAAPEEDLQQIAETEPIIYNPPAGKHRLVIVLAIEGPTPNICKTILSGMANGYPSPVIVNWESAARRQIKTEGGRVQLAKMDAVLEYLDIMMHPSAHKGDRLKPNDLVVLVDPSDSWWQLPPELLITRYHEANRLVTQRIAADMNLMGSGDMQQSIVTAAQKRCWPDPSMALDIHCDALPNSSVRTDLYGSETDRNILESRNPDVYKFNRPRFLNSGHIMGPAIDMQRYLRRAQSKMSRANGWKPDFKWDHGALGLVFGEQELWRTWLQSEQDFKADNPAMQLAVDGFEHHLGLDYEQQISIPVVAGQKDGDIFKLNSASSIAEASKKLGIEPARLRGVPKDINDTANPLEALLGEEMAMTWGDMPLYADLYSQAVPVMVHNNEWKNRGREGRVARMWDRTWFFPHLRNLVKTYLNMRSGLSVLAQLPAGYKQASYWPLPSETTKRRPRKFTADEAIDGLPEMEWDEVCHAGADGRPWFDEIFRDGLGPLEPVRP